MKTHFDNSIYSGHGDDIRWSARKLRPSILVHVILIFVSFMAISLFVFHSMTAVRSLALGALALIVALLPQVLGRFEYQADESGVSKRSMGNKDKEDFERIFHWSELTHVSLLKHGFKYFKNLDEKNPVQRFVRMQISDKYSGEIHVEKMDQDRIVELFTDQGVPVQKR